MKVISLTVWERVSLLGVIDNQRGGMFSDVRNMLRLIDVLALSDDDKAAVGFRVADGEAKWDKVEHEFKIELEDADFERLYELCRSFRGWPFNKNVSQLEDKLQAIKEGE